MPSASRKGDTGSAHGCFPPSNAIEGSPDVSINGQPALRVGDALAAHGCKDCPPHGRAVAAGSASVSINGKPAARIGDSIDCGGAMAAGSGNVFIGDLSWDGQAALPVKPKMALHLTQTPGSSAHPYSNEYYELYKDGALVQTGLTDEEGLIEYEYDAPWTSELRVKTTLREFTYRPIPLDPTETQVGTEQRLDLLGYYAAENLGNATQGSTQRYEFFQGTQNDGVSGELSDGLFNTLKTLL